MPLFVGDSDVGILTKSIQVCCKYYLKTNLKIFTFNNKVHNLLKAHSVVPVVYTQANRRRMPKTLYCFTINTRFIK